VLLGEEVDVFAVGNESDGDAVAVAVAAVVEALVMGVVWALAPELQNQYRQLVVVLVYH